MRINFVNSIQLLTSCCEIIKHACNGPEIILYCEAESIKELLVEESDNYTEKERLTKKALDIAKSCKNNNNNKPR